jgi:putative flavoprotein involved in K+ transport
MTTSSATATTQASAWLRQFGDALASGDDAAAAELFHDESYWRDMVAFTWNIKTMEGREAIVAMLQARRSDVAPHNWAVDGEAAEAGDLVEATCTFETAVGWGRGILRLRDGLALSLLTTLTDLKGFEEPRNFTRPLGNDNRIVRGRATWKQQQDEERASLGYTQQPYVLVVGGGQGGIALGARLRQHGVPSIIVERNPRAGDSWRNRYESLTLHDTVWYDHMPYIPFPEHWPVYTPKDQLGDWLEMYTRVMNLNYWGGTTCQSAAYDESTETWTVTVERRHEDGRTETVVLRPTHLVLATGMSGVPNMPRLPGAETFEGTLQHSSAFTSAVPWRGKRCVVLGSNNSAHDIAAALWQHEAAEITIIQRSGTSVSHTTAPATQRAGVYSQIAFSQGLSTEQADLLTAATPYRLMPQGAIEATQRMLAEHADFYAALEARGFMLDWGEDGSGLGMKYHRRGSGYYIDTGASQLIIDGEIAVRSHVEIAELKPRSVVLTDGTELPADLVVCATGFGSMNGWAARLISQEVADRVGKVWGIGSDTRKDPGPWEGEQRNMWKPTQQPGLWFHGGNLAQSRFFSKFVALQLKARYEGIATPVYGMTKPHHRE